MSSYQRFQDKKQQDSMQQQHQQRDVEVANNNHAMEENEETTTSTLGDFSVVTGSPIATSGSTSSEAKKRSGCSNSTSRGSCNRKSNIKIVRVQEKATAPQPSARPVMEGVVKDEEFGGGACGTSNNIKQMENSVDNHTITPTTTTTDASFLGLDAEHSNNKRRRCLLIGAAVLGVFLVSAAAATATAIGVAYGMSKINASSATSTSTSTAPVINTPSSATTSAGQDGTTSSAETTATSSTTTADAASSSYTIPTSRCATIRCGTSWLDADKKCGQQCLTEPCPDGEACFADMQTPLECCATTETSWAPPANHGVEAKCSSQRCGTSWSQANSNCGMACQADPEDACGPLNETCYQSFGIQGCCGTSKNDALTRCVTACTIPTCPSGESCFADLSTSTLSCCYPEPEPVECGTTRCGSTWANANNYCGQSCETDTDCTEKNNERCYADLTTNLDCCTNKGDEDDTNTSSSSSNITATAQPGGATIVSVPQVACTTTRCGLSWATANSNCGPNCVDNGDCVEAGHTCFADLTSDLACCRDDDSSNNGSDPVEEFNVSACTTVRCGLTWVTANSNCFSNCVDSGDCTEEGHTCFADLSIDLDCCSS